MPTGPLGCHFKPKIDRANCQQELHKWGRANQVDFDASKESQHVLSLSDPVGGNFRLLGVPFDTELSMVSAVSEIVSSAGWKFPKTLDLSMDVPRIGFFMVFSKNWISKNWKSIDIHCWTSINESQWKSINEFIDGHPSMNSLMDHQ